jgi:hypothetical protein
VGFLISRRSGKGSALPLVLVLVIVIALVIALVILLELLMVARHPDAATPAPGNPH